jgi:leader peptidase (prepilin peptidase)/N-methyltransferase
MLLAVAPLTGSFTECLAQRLPAHRPILLARSQCDGCHTQLGPLELIPVVSWVALRGRCRHCRRPIPVRHLGAELLAAAITVWALLVVPGWLIWPTVILSWVLLALSLMDLYHLVLADVVVLPVLGLGVATSFGLSTDQGFQSLAGAAIGGGAALIITALYRLVRRREGLGLGDVKLLAACGAWVSWSGLPSVVLIASLAAGVCLALGAARTRWRFRLTQAGRIPAGPFVAFGLWVVWLHAAIQIHLP